MLSGIPFKYHCFENRNDFACILTAIKLQTIFKHAAISSSDIVVTFATIVFQAFKLLYRHAYRYIRYEKLNILREIGQNRNSPHHYVILNKIISHILILRPNLSSCTSSVIRISQQLEFSLPQPVDDYCSTGQHI